MRSKNNQRNSSLPSILVRQESKLFEKDELKSAISNIKKRFQSNSDGQGAVENNPRAMIQFPKEIFKRKTLSVNQSDSTPSSKGFYSFREMNQSNTDEILKTLSKMRSKSTLLNKEIKAQVLFNKNSYQEMTKLCTQKSYDEKRQILERLKKMQPFPMKKAVKAFSKAPKQREKQLQIRLLINYSIYENNRTCFKPYFDYDAISFPLKAQGYFVSGRKECPIVIYDRSEDKWKQETLISGLKPFGESCPTQQSESCIIFFGGIRFYQPGISLVMNSIQRLDLSSRTNQAIEFSEKEVAPRAYHAQCIYGDYLIVSGGVDKDYHIQSDFIIYHRTKNYWNKLTIDSQPQRLKKGICKHKMISVLHKRKQYMIYEDSKIIEKQSIKHEGVYIFGGEDGDVELSNSLYLLSLGKVSLEIKQLFPKGTAPIPRKNFAMIRFKNYLVLQGGRNDQMNPFTLQSIHFLELNRLEWIEAVGQRPTNRYGHALMNFMDSEIVIFGGKNNEGLCKQILSMVVEEEYL